MRIDDVLGHAQALTPRERGGCGHGHGQVPDAQLGDHELREDPDRGQAQEYPNQSCYGDDAEDRVPLQQKALSCLIEHQYIENTASADSQDVRNR